MALNSIKTALRRTRRLVNECLGREIRAPIQHRCAKVLLGSDYGGWCICPDLIDDRSVIYSFGVGEDISFDLALIERFGATVHAFDPTPKAIRWVKGRSLPPQFRFFELGIAGHDGVATFALPRPDYVSYAFSSESPDGERVIQASVNRLATIMRRLGHSHIDVLKMDVEGAEYTVIDDLAQSGIPIGQLLVEFHHTLGNRRDLAQTARAIRQIGAMGMRLFHQSPGGREFSFIRPAAVAAGPGPVPASAPAAQAAMAGRTDLDRVP
jgi:FkbM family methyltransferase